MRKCKVCDGGLNVIGSGTYECPYCFSRFTEEDFDPVPRASAPTESRSNGGVDVFDRNKNGTAEIRANFPGSYSSGSGLLIDDRGYVITNAHVITNKAVPSREVLVKVAGETIRASIVCLGDDKGGMGKGDDLALLKLERMPSKGVPVVFENFANVRIGEQVFVIGNSLGDGTCITSGIVSDKSRNINGKQLLMTDCAINGGNSGGPIFNSKGRVIGVIVSSRIQSDGSATEGMNYAIPISTVEAFLQKCNRGF